MRKNTTHKCMRLGALTLIMALFMAGTSALAFGGPMDGPGRKGHGDSMKEHFLSRVDYTMQELQLSPDQQAKYSTIRAHMAKALNEAEARRKATREDIRNELNRPTPDLRKVAAAMKREARIMPDTMTMQIDSLLKVHDILNKKQQARLVEMIKAHMGPIPMRNADGQQQKMGPGGTPPQGGMPGRGGPQGGPQGGFDPMS
ncbi:Spy/CpxP family protein refolding chaperone [Pseudodesulfovibrio cashew]|nr:periplasmic heavy metal sensor [Pseudodesulfovibrio cashew]